MPIVHEGPFWEAFRAVERERTPEKSEIRKSRGLFPKIGAESAVSYETRAH
jgi:hypothetical protein